MTTFLNRRRLRPTVRVLFDSRNARLFSLAPFRKHPKSFEELMMFVRNCEFDNVGVFTYSDEEGTPAFDLRTKLTGKLRSSVGRV